MSINAVNSTSTPYRRRLTDEERLEKKQDIATGVGVSGAGLTRMASKRGLAKEKTLQEMLEQVSTTTREANKNTRVVKGLWGNFKHNIRMYTDDIIKRLNKFEGTKFVGKIVKSPAAKKLAGLFGGALAFFVLVTGVNKAINTGAIAVDDFRHQYDEFRRA